MGICIGVGEGGRGGGDDPTPLGGLESGEIEPRLLHEGAPGSGGSQLLGARTLC